MRGTWTTHLRAQVDVGCLFGPPPISSPLLLARLPGLLGLLLIQIVSSLDFQFRCFLWFFMFRFSSQQAPSEHSHFFQSTVDFFRAQSPLLLPLRCHRDFLVVHFLVVPILVRRLSFLRASCSALRDHPQTQIDVGCVFRVRLALISILRGFSFLF